jgi:histidinol-phosphatase (PHP family)
LTQIAANHGIEDNEKQFQSYITSAKSAIGKYQDRINILLGFEAEFIIPDFAEEVNKILARYPEVQTFIGSLHHVQGIPIDFSQELYTKALMYLGGDEVFLWETYYEEHYAMLQALKPPIVGHFDLIKLYSAHSTRLLGLKEDLPDVWAKVVRSLIFTKSYGGVLEVSSAALRKGLLQPYPGEEILKKWLLLGGKICLSDDAHSVAQVGVEYQKLLSYLEQVGVTSVAVLQAEPNVERRTDARFPTSWKDVSIEQLKRSRYFSKLRPQD